MRTIDADEYKQRLIKESEYYCVCETEEDIGAFRAYGDAIDELDEMPTIGGWIPCSERLPEDGNNVLICLTNGAYDIAFVYNDKYDCWVSAADDYAYEKESIVAWMPLPEPFKEV